MRKLGLIGGISWQSTLLYYRYLNAGIEERLGPGRSCEHVLYTADFHKIHALQDLDDWDALDELMVGYAMHLKASGAEAIVICANTMHRCAPAVEAATGLPILHIADATGRAIQAQGMKRIALLGTKFTMTGTFLKGRLHERFGLDVLVPNEADRRDVNAVIYNELTQGIISVEAKNCYAGIIERLSQEGAEGVILGCTEIPLLIGDADVNIPTFDTTKLHAMYALDWALAE